MNLLRAGFPNGLEINSPDYFALWSFLEAEEFSHRAIATALDFAFDLDYLDVLWFCGQIQDSELCQREIQRIESLLNPHGLKEWRAEEE
ncbi:MAG: hypothetical protein KDA84_03555 [Planctomycetaceae bacterium]|nr:hypothetical protein [Planctomycetaceae bacterium]